MRWFFQSANCSKERGAGPDGSHLQFHFDGDSAEGKLLLKRPLRASWAEACAQPGGCASGFGSISFASLSGGQPNQKGKTGATKESREVVSTADKERSEKDFELLPYATIQGGQQRRYVWDGKSIRAVNPEFAGQEESASREFQERWKHLNHVVMGSLFPDQEAVTPDYWLYVRWRGLHRVFSSVMQNFATQSLLAAVGVGAKKTLPMAAAINWILKDGLGRLGRLSVAARFGQSFDADLKRFRFATSLLFSASITLEYFTPVFPQHFLLLAGLANVGKSVGLTTHISTQPAFGKSFALGENMADITAKAQAQHMVMDTLGLVICVALLKAVENHPRVRAILPLTVLPVVGAGDLFCIYRELKAIHLRTLNRERAEMVAETWLATGRVPTAEEVSEQEPLLAPSPVGGGFLPLRITSLAEAASNPADLKQLADRHRGDRYMLAYQPTAPRWPLPGQAKGGRLLLALRDDAGAEDITAAIVQAAQTRAALVPAAPGVGGGRAPSGVATQRKALHGLRHICLAPEVVQHALAKAHGAARGDARRLVAAMREGRWQVWPFMLSSVERAGYIALTDKS